MRLSSDFFGEKVRVHGSKLEHPETSTVQAHTLLAKQRWALGIEFGQNGEQQEERQTDDQQSRRAAEIADPLGPLVGKASRIRADSPGEISQERPI